MSHQFVTLLSCGIQADGIVHLVIGGIRHFLVAAIHAARTCIDQMLHTYFPLIIRMTTSLQNVVKTNEIGSNV